ncbi:metal-dependent hydrolase [Oxalobacteraceae bacterium]|nr:metal-dependent hydrolase [Oxalobacteraceae bacterium]
MPSIISHAIVPTALGLALGDAVISRRLLLLGVIAAMLPDMDVLAFRFGVPYTHDFGHRGMSHSLAFALFLGMLAGVFAAQLHAPRRSAVFFVFLAAASHGLLDMLTNGGLGIALFWPISNERLFFPLRVIEVSPLSLRRFFSSAGVTVLTSEFLRVWLPSAMVGASIFFCRRILRFNGAQSERAMAASHEAKKQG